MHVLVQSAQSQWVCISWWLLWWRRCSQLCGILLISLWLFWEYVTFCIWLLVCWWWLTAFKRLTLQEQFYFQTSLWEQICKSQSWGAVGSIWKLHRKLVNCATWMFCKLEFCWSFLCNNSKLEPWASLQDQGIGERRFYKPQGSKELSEEVTNKSNLKLKLEWLLDFLFL